MEEATWYIKIDQKLSLNKHVQSLCKNASENVNAL